MEVKSQLKYVRISPLKVRLVGDLIRGLSATEAQKQLRFCSKKAADSLLKLLNSAIANAEHNFQIAKDNLYIKELRVDQGPTFKRQLPRARGRADLIRKRTSHVTLVLEQRKEQS